MKAVWQVKARSDRELCPFVFTTFRRNSAWRTKKFSPRRRNWALPPREVASSSLDKITAEYLEQQTHRGASGTRRSAASAAACRPLPTPPSRHARHRQHRSSPLRAASRHQRSSRPGTAGSRSDRRSSSAAPSPPPPRRRQNRRPPPKRRASQAAASARTRAAAASSAAATAAARRPEGRRQSRLHPVAAQAGRREPPRKPAAPNCPPGRATRGGPNLPGAATSAVVRGARTPPGPAMPGARLPASRRPRRAKPAEAGRARNSCCPPTRRSSLIKPPIVVRDLAEQLKQKPFKIIADLMELGVFANVNQAIDEAVAQKVCAKYGFRFEVEKRERGSGMVHAPVKKVELDVEDKLEDLEAARARSSRSWATSTTARPRCWT